jgi:hypothetical protein
MTRIIQTQACFEIMSSSGFVGMYMTLKPYSYVYSAPIMAKVHNKTYENYKYQ